MKPRINRYVCFETVYVVGNLIHAINELRCIFAATSFRADVFAQSVSLSVELLKCCFIFTPIGVDLQHFIDLRRVVSAASREPALHKVGLLTNETNVEHGAECSISVLLVSEPIATQRLARQFQNETA